MEPVLKKSFAQLIKDDEKEGDDANSTIVCTNYTSKIDGLNKTECKDTEPGKPVFHFKDNAEPLREVNIANSSANDTATVWDAYRKNQTAKRLNNTKQEELKKGDEDVKSFSQLVKDGDKKDDKKDVKTDVQPSTMVCTNYSSKVDGNPKTECVDTHTGVPVFGFKDNGAPLVEVNIDNSSANANANSTQTMWTKYYVSHSPNATNKTEEKKEESLVQKVDEVPVPVDF